VAITTIPTFGSLAIAVRHGAITSLPSPNSLAIGSLDTRIEMFMICSSVQALTSRTSDQRRRQIDDQLAFTSGVCPNCDARAGGCREQESSSTVSRSSSSVLTEITP